MPLFPRVLLAALPLLSAAPAAFAQAQIADLRLEADAFPGGFKAVDPGFGPLFTRQTPQAIEGVEVAFSGLSQNAGDPAPDEKDLAIRTYTFSTNLYQLNRFATDSDQSKAVRKVGSVQWSIDLTGLDQRLASRKAALESLNLVLVLGGAPEVKTDLYLSPGRAAPGARALDITPLSPEDRYRLLWLPAQARQPGDIVPVQTDGDAALGGSARDSFLLVSRGGPVPGTASIDLAPLYKAGVRKFSLVLASGSYGLKRIVEIREGSGLFLTTTGAR